MEIIIGKDFGFCFGVKRAVKKANGLNGKNNFILGELIHNDLVINGLKEKGINTIDCIFDSNLSNKDTLLIRTHGETKEVLDYAKKLGVKIIDCTCPFVKDIQKKAEEFYNKGYKIVIIGNKNHPEVIGINGWCNNSALITEDYNEINALQDKNICIVVQTTYSEQKFDEIIKNLTFDGSKTVDIFKTICYTTKRRQKEAFIISKLAEAIIVLGGTNSNNTQKLFEICSLNCKNTFRYYSPNDVDIEKLKKFKKIGIVFGASTPIEQFQEVIQLMENATEEIITTEVNANDTAETTVKPSKSEMAKAFDNIKQNKDFRIGQIVTAKISSANENGLMISLKDIKNDFELSKEELLNDFVLDDYKNKIGETIRVMIVGKNPLKFSEKAMKKVLEQEAEIAEIKDGKIFEVTITETNKGGLIGAYKGYQVFVPASQIKLGFVKDLDKFVGKTLKLKAEKVESKGARRQIVGSQKVILLAEKEERDSIKAQKEQEFFSSVQEGDVVLGTPVRFTNFGAFIDVNGFDCLAHISDLSWTNCKNCADVLEIGKQYEFLILKIDTETKRVALGYKQLQPKPWATVLERYKAGDVIKGKVVRIVSFGAFVEVEKGIDGLIHVSQISNKFTENPLTALTVGQEVDVKILDINPENEKMNLSIKALMEEEVKEEKKETKTEVVEEELREWKEEDTGVTFADLINDKN